MMALTERKIKLSFARNWCNVSLIEELKSEIKKLEQHLEKINS